jgi:ribosome-associated translation inhibitor RaiA
MQLSFTGITRSSRRGLRETFDARTQRILRRLGTFQPGLVQVEGHIEKNPHHRLYRVSLRLRVPGDVIAVAEEGYNLRAVLTEALDELERRAEKHLAQLRGEHTWRRAPRMPSAGERVALNARSAAY